MAFLGAVVGAALDRVMQGCFVGLGLLIVWKVFG